MSGQVQKVAHRLSQGFGALAPARIQAGREAALASSLTVMQAGAFRGLPAYDQVHLLNVHARLTAAGVTDAYLLIAGLLHDIGKMDQYGVVRLPDRVAYVLLRWLGPAMLARLAESPKPGAGYGLHLCVHHPRLGAERAAALGCNARTVWLIANHDADNVPFDRELALLQVADRG